jgi:hypothetical protein
MPTEITIPLDNKPGALAKVTEVLGKAGVNLEGIGYAAGKRGVLRVVADDTAKALSALKAAKVKVKATQEVLVATLPDRPGALSELARKLAKARVNIDAFYVVGEASGTLRCVLAVDKPEKAKPLI